MNGTTETIPFKLHLAIDFLGFCKRSLANIVRIANGKALEFIKIDFHLCFVYGGVVSPSVTFAVCDLKLAALSNSYSPDGSILADAYQ